MSATQPDVVTDDEMIAGKTDAGAAGVAVARAATDLGERNDFTLPVRHRYDGSQVAVIRQTVAKDCNAAELAMFLEVAARYRLDPFLREIFAAKFNGAQGAVTIFAGRDGLLKAAKLTGKLRRIESAVVRENDEYEVITDSSKVNSSEEGGLAGLVHLRHVRKGMGTGDPEKGGRGKIVGAYAMVWLKDEEDAWFAEATWEDYGADKQKTGQGKNTNWTLGHGYTEAMMIKVPQSIALRMSCGLAGLYAQEEVQNMIDAQEAAKRPALSGEGDTPGVQWPDGELGMTLQARIARANELVPGTWRPAKLAMAVNGRSEEELTALSTEVGKFIAQRVPDDPLLITDAVVVVDDAPTAPADVSTDLPKDAPNAAADAAEEEEPVAAAAPLGEPEMPWDPEAYDTLFSSAVDMEAALEGGDVTGDERDIMEGNLADVREMLEQLEAVRPKSPVADDGDASS